MTKRVAIYARVSTDQQTVENQLQELNAVASRLGWTVVAIITDEGTVVPRDATSALASTSC